MLFYSTGGASVLGIFFVATILPCTIGKRWKDTDSDKNFSLKTFIGNNVPLVNDRTLLWDIYRKMVHLGENYGHTIPDSIKQFMESFDKNNNKE